MLAKGDVPGWSAFQMDIMVAAKMVADRHVVIHVREVALRD
jgi:hypothetical protein